MTVVADSGPLIHLSWIDQLDLLRRLFGEVLVPPAVEREVFAAPSDALGVPQLAAAFAGGILKGRELSDSASADAYHRAGVDRGEAEVIALAEQLHADLLLCDDAAARDYAQRLGMTVSGTVGVLDLARRRGFILSAVPFLFELRQRGQWLSDTLIAEIEQRERK